MNTIDPSAHTAWAVQSSGPTQSGGDAFAAALAAATSPADIGTWAQWGHLDPATGAYVDNVTGRHAYYGPHGEPGQAWQPGQAVPAGMQTAQQPDGTWALYSPGRFTYGDPSRPANAPPAVSPGPLQEVRTPGPPATTADPTFTGDAAEGIRVAEQAVGYGGTVLDVVPVTSATGPYGPGFDATGKPTTGGDWAFEIGGAVSDPNGQWVRIG